MDLALVDRPGAMQLRGRIVAEVMVTVPKTMPLAATIDDARAAFVDDRVHMLLVVDSRGRLVTTVCRVDLERRGVRAAPGDRPVLSVGTLRERTVHSGVDAYDALALLVASETRRRAVVDHGGTLIGLLCLKRSRNGFCSDVDVASRAADRIVQEPAILSIDRPVA